MPTKAEEEQRLQQQHEVSVKIQGPPRPDRGVEDWNDITADAIFLLQRRQYCFEIWAANPHLFDGFHDDKVTFVEDEDGEGVPWCWKETGEWLTDKDLLELGFCTEHWEVVRVFFTRAEAERFAQSTSYNFPDGWRVYTVCAHGELAGIFNQLDDCEVDAKGRNLLRHTLGADSNNPGYRNRFVAGETHSDWYDLMAMVRSGHMVRREVEGLCEPYVFHATDKGKEAVL